MPADSRKKTAKHSQTFRPTAWAKRKFWGKVEGLRFLLMICPYKDGNQGKCLKWEGEREVGEPSKRGKQ
jgi:hypothetical protein